MIQATSTYIIRNQLPISYLLMPLRHLRMMRHLFLKSILLRYGIVVAEKLSVYILTFSWQITICPEASHEESS